MDLSEVSKLDAPAKVLKLSTAMRIGSRLRPQTTIGIFFDGIGSCALGAAYEAMSGTLNTPPESWLEDHALALNIYGDKYGTRVVEDNDTGGFTREQIADRLEAIGF